MRTQAHAAQCSRAHPTDKPTKSHMHRERLNISRSVKMAILKRELTRAPGVDPCSRKSEWRVANLHLDLVPIILGWGSTSRTQTPTHANTKHTRFTCGRSTCICCISGNRSKTARGKHVGTHNLRAATSKLCTLTYAHTHTRTSTAAGSDSCAGRALPVGVGNLVARSALVFTCEHTHTSRDATSGRRQAAGAYPYGLHMPAQAHVEPMFNPTLGVHVVMQPTHGAQQHETACLCHTQVACKGEIGVHRHDQARAHTGKHSPALQLSKQAVHVRPVAPGPVHPVM